MSSITLNKYRDAYPDVRPDYTVDQRWDRYTAEDHGVWRTLFDRQMKLLPGRVAPEFLDGVRQLDLERDGIPDFRRVNERLRKLTGWEVIAVPGLVPDDTFFEHLANRRFPAGQFIRKPQQLDYLQEPDIFHDVFGHVPMLALPVFADYMKAYGRGGIRAAGLGTIDKLARLYWYTVEFGLIRRPEGLRIYGAGIVSSKGESVYALDDPSPNRIKFDLMRLLRTRYRIDDYQQVYFVIDSFDELFEATAGQDFKPIYEKLKGMPDFAIDEILPTDEVLTRGTQAYARAKRAKEKVPA